MAINTQKLLPASTSTSALAVKTSRIAVSSGSKEKGGALVRSDRGALSRDILQMKTRVLKLQGVVESNRKENQKEQDVKRRNEEKEERKKREKKLEAKPGLKGIGLPNVVANLPGGSIVSAIKRYLGFTLLGWLVGKYNELGPKLEGFMKVAKPAFEGLVFATESILKGVYTFVETGYKAYDTINTGIKKLGGVGAEKTFNEFSGHLNKLLNGAIIASMLIISTAPMRPKGGPKGPTGAGGGTTKPATPKPRGYDAWARNFPQQAARDAARKPPTGAAAPKPPGGVKPGFGRFPVIGPLITFTIRTLVYKEAPQKAAAAAVGMGIGQAIGTFIGGLGAGALGLGTAGLGAIVAPLIVGAGSIIGGLVGEWIGAALYDAISGMFSKKTTGRANGGRVGSTGTTPRSSIKRSLPRRQRINPQNTSPGKDVGGRRQIENFYGKETIEKVDGSGFKRKETRGQIVVKELEKISKDVKKLPVDWVASIGGAYVDMTLGQKPDPNLAGSVARSFGQFIEGAMNSQISATTAEITKAFVGMVNGGSVPGTKPGEVSKKVSDNIEKRLQEVFNKSSAIALKSIRSQSIFATDETTSIAGGIRGDSTGRTGSAGRGDTISPLDYENLDGGSISSMPAKVQVLYDEFRNIGYTDEAAKRLIAEIGREGGFSNQNLFGTHTDPAAGITNQGMISWNQTRRDALLKAAKSAGVLDSNGNFKQTAESLRFQARFLANEVPVYSKELHKALRDEGASGAKISQLLRDKYIVYRTTGGYSGGPDPEYGSGKTKEWYLKIAPGLKPKDFAPIRGQSGTVSYRGRQQAALSVGYSPFMGMTGRPQIISGKGYRESTGTMHAGIDIESDLGTPLYAYTKGVVIRSGDFGDGYGNVVEFRDAKGNIHFFAHMKYDPKLKPGTTISKGQKVGEVGSTGRSQGPHLHWEIRNKSGSLVDPTVFTKENPLQSLEENRETKKQQASRGQFDIIIPLDHVPSNLVNKIPDKKGGNTYKYAAQTGADGRERQYTGLISSYVAERLRKQGYRVKIVRPEEFGNFEDYDNYITKQSRYGTTVLPFHLDADPNRGGTGFLARIRQNDTEDLRVAQGLAPTLKKYASIFASGQRYGGIDTQQNATIDRAAASPATLLELGSLVTLEKIFGRGFVTHPKYKQFLDELSTSISTVVPKRENKKTKDTYRVAMPASGAGGYTAENVRRAQANYQAVQRQKQQIESKRPWWDKFGWFGGAAAAAKRKYQGGATLSSSQPRSSISSLSRSGSLNMDTSDTQVLILRQTQIVYR